MNPKVDLYLVDGCGRCGLYQTPQCKVHKWSKELEYLRMLLLSCGLEEDLKWSQPCYLHQKKNIVILSAFKEYAALNFFKGALMADPEQLLVAAGENSQSARQYRCTSLDEIIANEPAIKALIMEAVEVEKSGKKVEFKKTEAYDVPEELTQMFDEDPLFKDAFYALTPGRQRGYLLYFSQAKQSATRSSRIVKMMPKIYEGKGYNDR